MTTHMKILLLQVVLLLFWAFPCWAGWTKQTLMESATEEFQHVAVGAGRNDGVLRLYVRSASRLAELTYESGSWQTVTWAPGVAGRYLAIAPGRNDGVNRLYLSGGVYSTGTFVGDLTELTWAGSTWTVTIIEPTNITDAPVVGMGRNDGANRIYYFYNYDDAVSTTTLVQQLREAVWTGSSWSTSTVGAWGNYGPTPTIGNGRGDSQNRLYRLHGAFLGPLKEYSWTGSSWTSATIWVAPPGYGEPAIVYPGRPSVAVGLGRNDGVRRMYFQNQYRELAEVTWNGTVWAYSPVTSRDGTVELLAARGDGKNRLYTLPSPGGGGDFAEGTWDGATWRMSMVEPSQAGAGWVVAGAGRNDGMPRLYVAVKSQGDGKSRVFEYTYVPPEPVGSSTGYADPSRRVRLEWSRSAGSDAGWYRIYWDAGTGTINYATPLAVLTHPATTWTSGSLSDGVTYKIAVRVMDMGLTEETNTSRVVSVTARDVLRQAQAIIKVPRAGKRIAGNRVTVMARLLTGSPSQTSHVLFQFRPVGGGSWQALPAVNAGRQPNPDTTSPYFIHWDVSGLVSGEYELRAVATDVALGPDPSPPTVTVRVDPTDAEVEERQEADGRLVKRERVMNDEESEVVAGDDETGGVTRLILPAGSLTVSTATVKMVANPSSVPTAPSGRNPIGVAREIALEHGQSDLRGLTATVEIPYRDDDDDGRVDGTEVPVKSLKAYVYESGRGWTPPGPSTVDTKSKIVRFTTPHLSLFALLGTPADTLDSVKVYPNPFKPTSGLGHTHVIFDNLTVGADVRVFSLVGELVWETAGPTDLGQVRWNGQNASGNEAVAGLYLYVVTNSKGEKRRGKLVIIR